MAHVKLRTLGRGAFGTAILYRREDDRSLVVIKEFDLTHTAEKTRAQAIAESEALGMLHHPNIITYYDTYEDEQNFFIEMEYADGGTLHSLIGDREEGRLFPESAVLWYAYQLLSGLEHVHQANILHRDIKSENIFLTSRGVVKLGDFGISRVLEDQKGKAATVVGTPYYMAPEMFRGQSYNAMCDIFSAGCVIHELSTLQRTFQATNIGAIMYRVTRGKYEPMDDTTYSEELRAVITQMLSLEPDDRPSASGALALPLFQSRQKEWDSKLKRLQTHRTTSVRSVSASDMTPRAFVTKSSSVHIWGGGRSDTVVPTFGGSCPAYSLAVGGGHFAVCTSDKRVFTWAMAGSLTGEDGFSAGQLGHGDTVSVRKPKEVEALQGLEPEQVYGGADFTLALTHAGQVLAWGSSQDGCLGLGENNDLVEQPPQSVELLRRSGSLRRPSVMALLPPNTIEGDDVLRPIRIPAFIGKRVTSLSCGTSHVGAVTDGHEIYTWGCGVLGRLGHGDEDDRFTPTRVETFRTCIASQIECGPDATAILSTTGQLYACGNNEYNKLCLNRTGSILSRRRSSSDKHDSSDSYDSLNHSQGAEELGTRRGEIRISTIFQPARATQARRTFAKVAIGLEHIALLDHDGNIIVSGNNSSGQLGCGALRPSRGTHIVRGTLSGIPLADVACGDYFTLATTKTGQLYGWGSAKHHRLGTTDQERIVLPRKLADDSIVAAMACGGAVSMVLAEKILSQQRLVSRGERKNSQDLASAAGDSLEEDGLPGEEGGASSAFTHDNTTPSVTMTDADDDSIAVEIHPEQVSPSAAKKAVAAPSAMARVEGAVVSPRLPEAEAEVVAAEAAALLDDLHVPDSLESDQARIDESSPPAGAPPKPPRGSSFDSGSSSPPPMKRRLPRQPHNTGSAKLRQSRAVAAAAAQAAAAYAEKSDVAVEDDVDPTAPIEEMDDDDVVSDLGDTQDDLPPWLAMELANAAAAGPANLVSTPPSKPAITRERRQGVRVPHKPSQLRRSDSTADRASPPAYPETNDDDLVAYAGESSNVSPQASVRSRSPGASQQSSQRSAASRYANDSTDSLLQELERLRHIIETQGRAMKEIQVENERLRMALAAERALRRTPNDSSASDA